MIREANISYAPEKIDEFIAEINKEIETAKAIYESALSKVKGMNVGDIAEDQSAAEAYKDKLVRAEDAIRKKHTKYFDIVDMYEAGDMPKNVYQLWKLTNTLDDYSSDVSKIDDVLDDIITAAARLTNFHNKQEF